MNTALLVDDASSMLAPAGQELTWLLLVPGVGMLLVGSGFLVYAWRRRQGMRYAGWGVLAWVVAVSLKFAWAIPINPGVYQLLSSLPAPPTGALLFDVYVGLLTGVFEVALVWVILSRTRLGRAPWNKVLVFGIGFGAIEAILLGVSGLAYALAVLLAPDQVPASSLSQFAMTNNLLFDAAPIVERAATIYVHIFSAGLIFFAIATGQQRWGWLAMAYKTAIDSVAAFAQFWGVNSVGHIWTIEAIVIVFGLMGWWGTRWLAEHYPEEISPSPLEPELAPLG